MVIGIDGSRAFIERRTGTEEYSYQLLKHLAEIDKKNTYIVYLRPVRSSQLTVHRSDWPKNFKFKLINFPRLWTQVGLAIHTFTDNLDLLFVPSHTLPLFRKPGLKTVMTIHDLGAEYLPSLHQLKQALYLKAITKLQLKSATHLIAVSQATKQDLVDRVGIDPKKVTVIYEGGPTRDKYQETSDKEEGVMQKFGLERQKYFLFIGTIQPRKNLERLIEAFSHQLSAIREKAKKSENWSLETDDSLKLVLAGNKGWQSAKIYHQPQAMGISDRVLFTGFITDEEKKILLENALALAFPSLFEGFGLPILEAFGSNCPVLTSNISSMPEVAGNAAILVDPYSLESILEGMMRMQNVEFRVKLIKEGHEQLKKFSWEKAARETLNVLESIK